MLSENKKRAKWATITNSKYLRFYIVKLLSVVDKIFDRQNFGIVPGFRIVHHSLFSTFG